MSESNITDLTTPAAAAAKPKKAATAVESAAPTGLPPGFSGKRTRITLHASDGELGKLPQDFAINGFAITIKRNVEVAVPEEFVQAIQNMATNVYNSEGDSIGVQPRFNITVHGPLLEAA